MPSFTELLNEKNKRLYNIPDEFLSVVELQQKKNLSGIISQLSRFKTTGDKIDVNSGNINEVTNILNNIKTSFLNTDYLLAVRSFIDEFDIQADLIDELAKKVFGDIELPIASRVYIDTAKRNSIAALTDIGIDSNIINPIKGILENAVVNGASITDAISAVRLFVEGSGTDESKVTKYIKQIANDSFAIADRSYTSILSQYLENDWFYYSGTEVKDTRCFCKERVGKYFHRKEIEDWGNGANLGICDVGGGMWQGEIKGTNSATIFTYLGGYNCLHSLIIASEFGIPESDMQRARDLGYIK